MTSAANAVGKPASPRSPTSPRSESRTTPSPRMPRRRHRLLDDNIKVVHSEQQLSSVTGSSMIASAAASWRKSDRSSPELVLTIAPAPVIASPSSASSPRSPESPRQRNKRSSRLTLQEHVKLIREAQMVRDKQHRGRDDEKKKKKKQQQQRASSASASGSAAHSKVSSAEDWALERLHQERQERVAIRKRYYQGKVYTEESNRCGVPREFWDAMDEPHRQYIRTALTTPNASADWKIARLRMAGVEVDARIALQSSNKLVKNNQKDGKATKAWYKDLASPSSRVP
jgi:hypothetical protein